VIGIAVIVTISLTENLFICIISLGNVNMTVAATKKCKKCGKELPLSDYGKKVSHNGVTYYNGKCKKCIAEQIHEYYEKHKNEIIENKHKYYKENNEKILEGKKVYYENNRSEILPIHRDYVYPSHIIKFNGGAYNQFNSNIGECY